MRWLLVASVVIGGGLFQTGQRGRELPPMHRVPYGERLWVATIGHGRIGEAYQREVPEIEKICSVPSLGSELTQELWQVCLMRHINARYRIALLHAAPSESSPVVASIFEERQIRGSDGLHFTWTVESTSTPGKRLAWPDAEAAFDYGLHLAGVQRRGDWVRLLTSIPADGWLKIADSPKRPDNPAIYISVDPLEGMIVDLAPLTASWPDGSRRLIETRSYRVLKADAGTIEFREEIPSDMPCGESFTDPVPLPPRLVARPSDFFNRTGTPRFLATYTKGC